jgi:sugar phosphate permease
MTSATALGPVRQNAFYGWKLLAALLFIVFANFAFPLYGSSVINAYMAASLHFDRRTLGFAFAVFHWLHGVPGPLVALCVNRKGVRFTLAMGGLLIAAGAFIMFALARTSVEVVVAYGILIGLGTLAGGTLPSQSVIARWFVRRKARAISLLFAGIGIGGVVAPPLLNRVIAAAGGNWRAGWLVVCALSLVAALLALWFVKERPADLGQVPDGELKVLGELSASHHSGLRGVYRTTEEWTFSEVLRSPTLWLLLVASLGYSVGYPAFLAHGVVHLKDLGHTPGQAAFSISIMVFASLIGNLIVAALGDYVDPKHIWAAAMLLFGGGLFLAVHASGAAGLYLYAMLMGVGFGSLIPCMMTVPANYFGHKAYPSIVGLILAVGTTIGSLGSYAAGYAYDRAGTYAPVFYFAAVLSICGTVLLACLRPPVRKAAKSMATTVASDT